MAQVQQQKLKTDPSKGQQKTNKAPDKTQLEKWFARLKENTDRTMLALKLAKAWEGAAPKESRHLPILEQLTSGFSGILVETKRASDAVMLLQQARYTPPAAIKVAGGANKYVIGVRVWIKPEIIKAKHYDELCTEGVLDLDRLVVAKVAGETVDCRLDTPDGPRFALLHRSYLTTTKPEPAKKGA